MRARLAALAVACAACAPLGASTGPDLDAPVSVARGPLDAPAAQGVREDLTVGELAPGVLLHVSQKELPEWGRVSSNGLVVLGTTEALVIDTAWDDVQTAALFDHVERVYQRKLTQLLVTHSHDDRMGGIGEALRRGLVVHGLALTAERARAAGEPPPTRTFYGEAKLLVDGRRVEVFFPGAAHAPDNVVAWIPDAQLLFGTCMIREADAHVLGNLTDASLTTWVDAVEAIQRRFPVPAIVVPGHGQPGDARLLDHTLELARAGK